MDDSSGLILLFSIGGSIVVTLIVILVLVVILVTRSSGGGGIDGGGGGGGGSGQSIPIGSYPFPKNTAPWYTETGGNNAISASDGILKIQLKKHSTGGSSGGGFKANPHKTFPCNGVELSYMVKFPDDFDWKKGGKLPGVCWGTGSWDCSTGSNWSTRTGSFRVMWRESGQAIGYAYLAVTGSGSHAGNTAMDLGHGDAFKKSVRLNQSNKSGLDIWHKHGTQLQFKKGWNTVTMRLEMNTPGSADGVLSLTVNGNTNTVKDAILRTDKKTQFNNANIVAFRGGNGKDWEGDTDTHLEFKNFTIRKLS